MRRQHVDSQRGGGSAAPCRARRRNDHYRRSRRDQQRALWVWQSKISYALLCWPVSYTHLDHHPFVLIVAGLDRASDLLVSHLRTTSHRVEVMLQGADDSPIIGRPDLVIINSHLFSFNIVQTLHNIRKSALLNSAPIVVLSALHLPGDREAALAGGADAYCIKPLSKQEFDQLIALCHA